ncbi:hypothetical protein GCM10009780_10000 [Actinomadura alba]
MTAEPWRALIDAIDYSVQFDRELTEAVVERITRALLREPLLDLTEAEEYQAITEALRSGSALTEPGTQAHGEREFRDFLRRLLRGMDAARPWPEPPFRTLGEARWTGFVAPVPLLRVHMDHVRTQDRLHRVFRRVDDGGRRLILLILRLRSGDEVALVTPWWPGSDDVAVLRRDRRRRPADDAVEEFLTATGIRPDEVAVLSEDTANG